MLFFCKVDDILTNFELTSKLTNECGILNSVGLFTIKDKLQTVLLIYFKM